MIFQPGLKIQFILQFGREGKGNKKFGGPFGIHVSSENYIYIADDLNHGDTEGRKPDDPETIREPTARNA